MRKLLACALLLAMCMAMFAACSNEPAPTEPAPTAAPATEPVDTGLDNAIAYIKTVYKTADGTVTNKDFTRIGTVPTSGEKLTVVWTADVAEDMVKAVVGEDGTVTIDVNEESENEVPYVLTATVTDSTGASKSLSWNHVLPAAMDVDGLTYAEIVDLAYTIADGAALEDPYRLFGTVTSIDSEWSEEYGNITVTIAVAGKEDMPIQCYRLQGEGAKDLKVGDAITVEGILKNYKGTYEFDAKCELIGYGDHPDQKALLKAAFNVAEGAAMDYPAVMTGTVAEITDAWSEEYGNITINMDVDGQIVMAYRLSGEGAKELAVGDTVTVAGIIKNYKGTVEFDQGCKLIPNDMYHSVKNALSAYKLQPGEAQEVAKTVTGTIVSIDSAYSEEYKNITVTIVVAGLEDYPIQCYRLAGEGAEKLAEGDTITVTGILKNYEGTFEFDAGCTLG